MSTHRAQAVALILAPSSTEETMVDPAVLALAALGLVDSISFMIVAPSLAFYVDQLGGTQDAYGFILAVYSFAA